MKKNDVSVILTNFNYGELIFDTVGDLLRQTVRPSEIIIIDDCSTDHSPEILSKLEAQCPFLRIIRNEKNLGCAASVNKGLQMATGRYAAALAMDDPLKDDHWIEKAVVQTHAHPDAGFYFGEALMECHSGQDVFPLPIVVNLAQHPRYFSPHDFAAVYRGRVELSIPTVPSLWQRKQFLEIGGLLEQLGWLADWFAALVMGFRSGVCYIPGPSQIIRYDPRSISKTGIYNTEEYRRILRHILDMLEEPAFSDVREFFKIPAVIARHGFLLLNLCVEEDRFAKYLSKQLIENALKCEKCRLPFDLNMLNGTTSPSGLQKATKLILRTYSDTLLKDARRIKDQGNYTIAVRRCQKALSADPGNADALAELNVCKELAAKWARKS